MFDIEYLNFCSPWMPTSTKFYIMEGTKKFAIVWKSYKTGTLEGGRENMSPDIDRQT